MLKIVEWSEKKRQGRTITAFLERSAFPAEAEKAAAEVLAAIRVRGDAAIAEYVAKFEGAKLAPGAFRVSAVELKKVDAAVPMALKRAVRDAHARVMRFSKASLRAAWTMKTPRGGLAGEFFSPMDRVGVYVPGGTAPLASTSVMTVTLAKAAGVEEIVACTPAGKTGAVNPVLLYRGGHPSHRHDGVRHEDVSQGSEDRWARQRLRHGGEASGVRICGH